MSRSSVCFVTFVYWWVLFSEFNECLPTPSGPFRKDDVVILDVDAGTDDAIALTIALQAERLKIGPPVIAVTCANGNTVLKNVLLNVARTLKANNRNDVPVFAGTNESLVFTEHTDSYFGSDGMGDVPFEGVGLLKPQKEHAVLALIRLVNQFPKKVVLFSLGVMTNIALAQKLDPEFLSKLKEIFILGGTIAGIGNVRPGIEFNAHMDPEAFHIVFTHTNSSTANLLPYDPVYVDHIKSSWWKTTFGNSTKKETQFVNGILQQLFRKTDIVDLADPILYAIYLRPQIIKKSDKLLVTVVKDGGARGGMLVDYNHLFDQNGTNLKVTLKLNLRAYKELLTETLL